jgi:hypothetical protein
LYYATEKIEDSGTTQSESKTGIYDIKLGKIFPRGWYLGGLYTSESNSLLNQSGSSGSALGASGGYFAGNGLFAVAHYLLQASTSSAKEGSGYQLDFGYKTEISSNLYFGAEITLRNVTYKKLESGVDINTTVQRTLPMISIGYLF